MNLLKTLDLALKDRAPKFREELRAAGQLTRYLQETADPILDEIGRSGTDKKTQALPYMEKVRAMNAAAAVAREIGLSEAIANLPDERSPQSQD